MNRRLSIFTLFLFALSCQPSHALTLDWGGYFRAAHEYINDYQMDKSNTVYPAAVEGEYIPGQGDKSSTFSTFFMKLKPRVLVNDNIIVHSEWNVGDPVYGFFGRSVPQVDRTNALSTGKDSMNLTVSRLWLDVHSDFGTVQVGRAPMHWGLGVLFNSGDNPFDRYQSTSDTIRLISKFGYLSLMPLYAKNSMGRNLTGSRNPLPAVDAVVNGDDDVTDFGVGLRYENPEEDLDAGFLFYKRNAADNQTSYYYPSTATTYTVGANGMNLKMFDFYVKKSWHRFELGGEIPIYNGDIGDVNGVGTRNDYKAAAVAIEAALKFDTWKHTLKLGSAPGQSPTTPSTAPGGRGRNFSAVQFHRAYKLGLILFNYNLGNLGPTNPDCVPAAAPATNACNYPYVVSPYDAAITNARYVMLSTEKRWEQWGLNLGLVWAKANESAESGKDSYNHRLRKWFSSVASQSKNMGIEADFGTRYNWDDNISFGADFGMFFPGEYFKFINSASLTSPANTVTAINFSVATVF